MAIGLGFSMEEAGKGAEGLRKMMDAPSAIEADISGNKAEVSKNQYEKSRFEALSNYMEQGKNQPAPDASGIAGAMGASGNPGAESGKAVYGTTQMFQQLQKERQEAEVEEKRLSALAPEDRQRAEGALTRKQANIDKTEMALLKQTDRQLGEDFSILEAITDQPTFDRAKAYKAEQFGAMAEEAGITDPDQKKKFVDDHVEKSIGKNYDPTTIQIKKDGMLSVSEQIKFKGLEKQIAALNKQTLSLETRDRIANRTAQAKLNSDDHKVWVSGLKDLEDNIKNNRNEIEDIDKQIKDARGKIPKPKVGGFWGINQNDNPEYKAFNDSLDEATKRKDALIGRITEDERLRKVYQARVLGSDDVNKTDTPESKPEKITPEVEKQYSDYAKANLAKATTEEQKKAIKDKYKELTGKDYK